MKKIVLIFGTIFLSVMCMFSQERFFKPFKVDAGLTIDMPTSNNLGTGGGIYIEPRYGVNDNFTIGLRIAGVYLNSGNVTIDFTSVKVSTTSISPVLLTGDYCFSLDRVRPFVGLGVGMFKKTIRNVDVSAVQGISIGPQTITNFGFAPRVGLNVGHLRIGASYNYTGKDISDYMGIQIGFEFGGGRY